MNMIDSHFSPPPEVQWETETGYNKVLFTDENSFILITIYTNTRHLSFDLDD